MIPEILLETEYNKSECKFHSISKYCENGEIKLIGLRKRIMNRLLKNVVHIKDV